MKKSDFYYDLPQELIAQKPIEPRTASRLMVLDKTSGNIEHRTFADIKRYLKAGDCLVLNDTRVMPARIYGIRTDTGSVVEFLMLKQIENDLWEVLAGPGKKARKGHKFTFSNELSCEVEEVLDNGNRIIRFAHNRNLFEILDRIGERPLPHYITEKLENKERYQTVHAKN